MARSARGLVWSSGRASASGNGHASSSLGGNRGRELGASSSYSAAAAPPADLSMAPSRSAAAHPFTLLPSLPTPPAAAGWEPSATTGLQAAPLHSCTPSEPQGGPPATLHDLLRPCGRELLAGSVLHCYLPPRCLVLDCHLDTPGPGSCLANVSPTPRHTHNSPSPHPPPPIPTPAPCTGPQSCFPPSASETSTHTRQVGRQQAARAGQGCGQHGLALLGVVPRWWPGLGDCGSWCGCEAMQ